MRSSLSSEGFFRSSVTMEDVSGNGKVPVESERLTILQMVGEVEEDVIIRILLLLLLLVFSLILFFIF